MNSRLCHMACVTLLGLLALAGPAAAADKLPNAIAVSERSFKCMTDMTPVRGFYVDNLSGSLDKTLAVARSDQGGVYPPGSVVQLVPSEVMLKQPPGTNAATQDWEFFELDVSAQGTKIVRRGYSEVVNRFGGNCLACHAQASAQWDLICEQGHGCAPIPLTRAMTTALQRSDPRCSPPNPLRPEDLAALQALQAMMKAR